MRTEAMNTALANSISLDRLEKYLRSQGDDLGLALSAYEMNLRLSEAFYPPLQCLEVCLRTLPTTR